jgi:hydroxymethylglutaryl-CoA lyase
MLENVPDAVTIYEVAPRDGLQNEPEPVPLGQKHLLIQSLVGAGLRNIEVTSLVSPRWVPQLADADELLRDIGRPGGVRFGALCPNSQGLERARHLMLDEIAVFLSASETHNQKNTNKSIARSLEVFRELVPLGLGLGLKVRAYISTLWGCPYDGDVDVAVGLQIARELVAMGCYQVSLGDTIGVGTPLQTKRICDTFLAEFAPEKLALHLHDTRGTALANALVGLECGIRTFDASIAGLGGCPYAPGAAGNLATEDLVYMLDRMGVHTGVNLEALVEAGNVAQTIVGRRLPGKVHQAGLPRTRKH